MASFTRKSSAPRSGDTSDLSDAGAPRDPLLWILLADEALDRGCRNQAEELIAQAYDDFDDATARNLIRALEEEDQLHAQ